MEKIITNQELDKMLRELVESSKTYYSAAQSYFQDLYYTGCRSSEPLVIDRWKYTNNKIILSTMKTEAIRFFNPEFLSHDLLISIEDGLPPYGGLTYDQLTAEFRKLISHHPIYSGNRIADTYLFRYNRARLIYDEFNSLIVVKDFFGWNSLDMAASYVTQPLRYTDTLFGDS